MKTSLIQSFSVFVAFVALISGGVSTASAAGAVTGADPGTVPVDMYSIKARVGLDPDPSAMPVVVSRGTVGGEADGCVGPDGVVCAFDHVFRLYHMDFRAGETGGRVRAASSSLAAWFGHPTPDTMLMLLECDDDSCSRGTVVSIDDNGNEDTPEPFDSLIVARTRPGRLYRLVMTGAAPGGRGTASLEVSFDDARSTVISDVDFGGWHVTGREIREGDTVFVGKNSNSISAGSPGHREYHDSKLLILDSSSADCDDGCGRFLFNDDFRYGDSSMFLSRVTVPVGFGDFKGRVIVGVHDDRDSAGTRYSMNARLFFVRRGESDGGRWTGPDSADLDGDGLTAAIEHVLGSCDSIDDVVPDGVGIQGMSCRDYAARVASFGGKWTAADSDNDGLSDSAEVFAKGVHCTRTPAPPYNNPGRCTAFGFNDDPRCPDGEYCVGLDVSALSDPNPHIYDVYVFNDYIESAGLEYKVTTAGQDLLKNAWHDAPLLCWDGSSAPCEGKDDLPYLFNVHVYSDEGPGMHVTRHQYVEAKFGSEVSGGVRWTLAYFNRFFKPEFRYTGVGFFTLSTSGSEGQSARGYRSLVWRGAKENDDRSHSDVLSILSHEVGHLLGLSDLSYTKYGYGCPAGGACVACPEVRLDAGRDRSGTAWPQYPNVPSLMNYGYNSFGAGMRPLTSDAPSGTTIFHEGCSRSNLRFSKGLLGELAEDDLVEVNPVSRGEVATWRDRMLVREVECFTDKGRNKAPHKDPFKGYCRDGVCRINWDAYRFEGEPPDPSEGPYRFDLSMGNLGGEPTGPEDCSNDRLVDRNELATMQAIGKDRLGRMYQPEFDIFKATFNGGVTENLAGWDTPLAVNGVSYPEAVVFSGRCANDSECVAIKGKCDIQAGMCVDQRAVSTFRKAARFDGGTSYLRVVSTGAESPMVAIADSNKFMIRFDFMPDGFASGAGGVQFLLGHEDIRIYLEPWADEGHLVISGYVGSSRVRALVRAGQWNRVFFHTDVIDGRNVIKMTVVPWNAAAGRFATAGESFGGEAVECSQNSWTGDFDANGDMWIGSHVGGLFPFRGMIDNVNFGNFIFRPAVPACQ